MRSLNKKGISPVIATVIIVSVAIAIAVAVAFWMTGITGLFTRYEKIEITNAYAVWTSNDTDNLWIITLQLRNSGSDDATIDELFINVKPSGAYDVIDIFYTSDKQSPDSYGDISGWEEMNFAAGDNIVLSAGQDCTLAVVIVYQAEGNFQHGQSVEIKVHTVAGKEYPKTVVLP